MPPIPPKPILLVWLTLRHVPSFTVTEAQIARWQARLPELEIIHVTSQEDFIRNLSKATYIFTSRFSEPWLALTYRAKWIATPAAGRELLGPIPDRMLATFGTFHGDIMAETAAGMLLAVRRGLLPGLGLCAPDTPWPQHTPGHRTIAGSTAVILGYGHIGKAVGAKLEVLGIRVRGISRSNFDTLDTLLPTADALILALPDTPQTDRLVDARRLALLPPHAVLINIGRGNAVDEKALREALTANRLHAAFLDVINQEPADAADPLLHTPRCYLLPHASAFAPDYLDRAFDEWFDTYTTRFRNK